MRNKQERGGSLDTLLPHGAAHVKKTLESKTCNQNPGSTFIKIPTPYLLSPTFCLTSKIKVTTK